MVNKIEMISISKEEYDRLVENQRLLDALRSAGVDNWEGYDIARESLDEDYR